MSSEPDPTDVTRPPTDREPGDDGRPPGPERADRAGAPTDDTGEREPDYRFTLANERTFLAWIRTSLALLAGGIALDQLASFEHTATRTALSVVAVTLSLVLAVSSYLRWWTVQQAMRRGEALPHPVAIPVLATTIAVVAAGTALAIIVL